MRPEELAAHSRAIAAKNERKVLAVLATAGSTGVRAGRDLAELADLAPRTMTATITRLEDRGLVRRTGRRCVYATPAGRSESVVQLARAVIASPISFAPMLRHRTAMIVAVSRAI